MASKRGNLPLGFSYYIKNLLSLTSLEGKHLIGSGDKQRFVPPLVFCPWLDVSRASLSSSMEAAELMEAVIVVPLCCRDPSVALQLQPVSLHDTWQAQATHSQNTSGQIPMGSVANR